MFKQMRKIRFYNLPYISNINKTSNYCSCALYKKNTSVLPKNNLKLSCASSPKNFHISGRNDAKLFLDLENSYIYDILNPASSTNLKQLTQVPIITKNDFESLLQQNWRLSSASEIVKAFQHVKTYCCTNNISLSDSKFDQLVDGLMDHCEKLTDEELFDLLLCVSEYPQCETFQSHNFHDLWSCLDDMCLIRLHDWDIKTSFQFADVWYKLNLGRLCDFIPEILNRLPLKAEKLTKDELVRVFFYYNIARKRPVDFELEFVLDKFVGEMTIDEMAVVALGYFKTKSKIKLVTIMSVMVDKVIEESKTVHEISLTAILKILRFSKPTKLLKEVNQMLDCLTLEIDRISNLCCLHVALMGTGLQSLHVNSLTKCTEKILKDIKNPEKVRLKDVERLLNALTMFNFDPQTQPDVFQSALGELLKEERRQEISKYRRCVPSALHYLSLKGIYSHELMDKVLDLEFIKETYGKGAKLLPRELFSLNSSIDIECPGYEGNRLPLDLKYKAAKWLTDFTPSYDQYQKISLADKLVLDVIDEVTRIVKDKNFIFIDHVLPHFSRADIILCKDKETGNFVRPEGFEKYVLGDVQFPLKKENLEWISLVILGWNNTIKDCSLPLGLMVMKERQLRLVGYTPALIYWNEFMNLPPEDKTRYISSKLGLNVPKKINN